MTENFTHLLRARRATKKKTGDYMTLAAGRLRRKIVDFNGCPESKRELNYCVY